VTSNNNKENNKMTEYVVWGLPPGKTDLLFDEIPLRTKIGSLETAKDWQRYAEQQGCTNTRIQVIDGSKPDFIGTLKIDAE